jgi:putative MATE family efflux protein
MRTSASRTTAATRSPAFADQSISGALLRLSAPIIFANLLQAAYQMTDTFWVGRLNAAAVAAVSFSFPISFVFNSIGGGLPIAGAVMLAQYAGRGDEKSLSHVAVQTLLMAFLASMILTGGGYVLANPILRWMGAAPDVLPDAVRFLQVMLLGQIFVFGFLAYQALMRGLGIVYGPMYIVFLTVLLNFALDPLFIFGYGRVPAMGCAGAAMATVCTQALASVIGFTLFVRGQHGIRPGWRDFRPDMRVIGTLFRLGVPASIEQAAIALGLTMLTVLVSRFGTVAVAAYGVGTRVQTGLLIMATGLSMATSTLVGFNIGAGHLQRAERTTTISCLIGFSGLLGMGVIAFVFATAIAAFLMPEGGAAIQQSAHFIRVMAFTFGFMGMQHVLWGALRGAGDTMGPMVLAWVSLWGVRFPLAYVLSRFTSLGSAGIWWAFPIAFVLSAAITALWYLKGGWRDKPLLEGAEPRGIESHEIGELSESDRDILAAHR